MLVLAGLALSGACASAPAPCAAIVVDPDRPRASDLACLEVWIDLEQSWTDAGRAQARAEVEALRERAVDLSDPEFLLAVAEIAALADNGHSNMTPSPIYRLGLIPIRTMWFDDGLFIVRAAPEFRDLVGAEIKTLAGRSPDELQAMLGRYVGGTDELFRAYYHEPYLLSPGILFAAGLSEDPERIALVVESASQPARSVSLERWDVELPQPWANAWRYLPAEQVRDEDQRWPSVFSSTSGSTITPAWALQQPDAPFRYRYLPEHELAHVQFRFNDDVGDDEIERFIRAVGKQLKRDRPTHVILDNRSNGGGDLTLTAEFARTVHDRLPADGIVYSLTSAATFSAGIYTAMLSKAAQPERSIVVGGRVGDRERFWAEAGPSVRLPGLGVVVNYALELHDLGAGCQDPHCHLANEPRWNLAVTSFEPDVRVATLAADVFAGRDAQVEWALADVEARGH